MKIALINPPLISKKHDPHTGIVMMPFMLAYLSAYLKHCGHHVQVVDGLGEAPWQFSDFGRMQIQGLPIPELISRIDPDTQACFIHFGGIVAYAALTDMVSAIKKTWPHMTCVVVENAQAVTASSVRHSARELLDAGFDVLLYGDTERSASLLLDHLERGQPIPEQDGFVFSRNGGSPFMGDNIPMENDLDALPFPDWESFPLAKYWSLGYGHGPTEGPYLPLLTSRGCPLPCRFCTIPSMSNRRWRARSAKNVVDEMECLTRRFNVTEFHLEDVNPTVDNKRTMDLCAEILARNLKVRWKIVAGTKIETIKLATIPLMAKAGCTFIGFAPETGSPELLKKMNKPFNHELALELVKSLYAHGIVSQAVFVLGFPGETPHDAVLTARYMRRLAFAGADEIAQYIITPIPGSAIFDQFSGYDNLSELTFSPIWRTDYRALAFRRTKHYLAFFFWKAVRYPHRMLRHVVNIFSRRFHTKMEQAVYRVTLWRVDKWKRRKPQRLVTPFSNASTQASLAANRQSR